MAGRGEKQTPGFNAPLEDSGPIVSKRTGRRRARVQQAFGAPAGFSPRDRLRQRRHSADDLDAIDEAPERSPVRGISITLFILVLLGTRGFGLFDGGSDDPEVPPATTQPPQLVQRLPSPPPATDGDGSIGD